MALGSAVSKAALGFDPIVWRVSCGPDKMSHYWFKVNGAEYEVIEVIGICEVMFLLGHANRIFRVRRVENNKLVGPTSVLKDLWLPEGAKTELEILQDIETRVNQGNPVKDLNADDLSKHFVMIDECEIVKDLPSMTNPDVLAVDDNSTSFLRGQLKDAVPSQTDHFGVWGSALTLHT
uniref:Uncharacterized protein n=1 Tax=Moniliophthora roreri TaxID=221103 RepID=A0A0W0FAH9_MONRR